MNEDKVEEPTRPTHHTQDYKLLGTVAGVEWGGGVGSGQSLWQEEMSYLILKNRDQTY